MTELPPSFAFLWRKETSMEGKLSYFITRHKYWPIYVMYILQGNRAHASCKYQWFAFFLLFCLFASGGRNLRLAVISQENRPSHQNLTWASQFGDHPNQESFLDLKQIQIRSQHPELRHSFATPCSHPRTSWQQLPTAGAEVSGWLIQVPSKSYIFAPTGHLDSSRGPLCQANVHTATLEKVQEYTFGWLKTESWCPFVLHLGENVIVLFHRIESLGSVCGQLSRNLGKGKTIVVIDLTKVKLSASRVGMASAVENQ